MTNDEIREALANTREWQDVVVALADLRRLLDDSDALARMTKERDSWKESAGKRSTARAEAEGRANRAEAKLLNVRVALAGNLAMTTRDDLVMACEMARKAAE